MSLALTRRGTRTTAAWTGASLIIAAVTVWAMFQEVATFGNKSEALQTGLDFSNNTWRAVRGLVSGVNVYAPTRSVIPGIGRAWPVSQHVPASLLWQAPVAVLPLGIALFAFTFASIAAIWLAVFLLALPKTASAVLMTAACGAFAIGLGSGPVTLLMGQPTGFMLLGLAIVLRARRPWVAGLGLMLAASTLQTGIPVILALLVLSGWPIVWRGVVLILLCSLPPVALAIAETGPRGFVVSFVSGASYHLGRLANRIDLGALLHRFHVTDTGAQITAGLLVAAVALIFASRLPGHLRHIDDPRVFSLVIAFTLLCTYHESYDMLLAGGGVVPLILLVDRSRAMLPAFALAAIGAAFSVYTFGLVLAPVALIGIGLSSGFALRLAMTRQAASSAGRAAGQHDPGPAGVDQVPAR